MFVSVMKSVLNTWKRMENSDFAVFILTHGRPDNVITYRSLIKSGYTGRIFFIIDNEDATADKYRKNFGDGRVIIFDKKAMADDVDEGNNFDERRTITHARNACFKIAAALGITYFIQLDDDYGSFLYRNERHGVTIKNIDAVFDALLRFYISTPALSIALSQGGDHIGGFSGLRLKRKCMNSFICSTRRPFQFIGAMNEDVNTYTTLGNRGFLFFTFTGLQLNQAQTQSQAGGITDMYLRYGTYCKAFTTVMMHPSAVKVYMMSTTNSRIHHNIKWGSTAPLIIDPIHTKLTAHEIP
jgi:hypothetical protein